MTGLLRVSAVMGLTLIGLLIFTRYQDPAGRGGKAGGIRSTGEVLGYPVVSMSQVGARGVVAISQADARGVLAFGQLAFGLVTVAQGGVGLIAGVGQGMLGLLAVAQIGVGIFFFLGQMGAGLRAAGQGVVVRKPWTYFQELFAELDAALAGRPADPPA